MRIGIILAFALAAGGCELILGIDDPSLGPEGGFGERDAGVDPGLEEARLGLPCGEAHRDNGFDGQCPGDSACLFELGVLGSPDGTVGFCSPICAGDDQICRDAYTGPAEGDPSCGAGELIPPEFCTVGFNGGCLQIGSAVCPENMVCQPFDLDGQIGQGCVPMEWSESGSGGGGTLMNSLGELCGPDYGGCPPGHTCISQIANFGDPDGNGYCSPDCSNDPNICSDGYTGPPEGEPICGYDPDTLLGSCGIDCSDFGAAACPNGMACYTLETSQGLIDACGGETWTAQSP